jgi:hypothetical protein
MNQQQVMTTDDQCWVSAKPWRRWVGGLEAVLGLAALGIGVAAHYKPESFGKRHSATSLTRQVSSHHRCHAS